MRRFARQLLLIPLFAAVFISLTGVITPEWKLVVRLCGTVESFAAQGTGWIYIHQARLLKDGDKARTKEDSRAKIQLADQSIVTIGSNTTVEIANFRLRENVRIVELKMQFGRLRANVAKFFKGESKFEVRTTNATLAARGTDFYVDVHKKRKGPSEKTRSQYGEDRLLACINPHLLLSDSQNGNDDEECVFISIFSGEVEVITKAGHQAFFAGDKGLINSHGAIFVNPLALPSELTSMREWHEDRDLREIDKIEPLEGINPEAPTADGTGQIQSIPPPVLILPSLENTGTLHINVK